MVPKKVPYTVTRCVPKVVCREVPCEPTCAAEPTCAVGPAWHDESEVESHDVVEPTPAD
jgi:hypothetical protein